MERVKRSIITIHILLATILLLLTTCKRDERDNPWDKFAAINPDAWAPKAVQTSNIDITKHEVAWTYEGDNRIEGFRIDRKEGDSEWEVGVFTAEKDDRSWIDTNVIPDTTLTYTYKVYAIAGDSKSSNIIASIDVEFPAPTSIDIEKISDISYKLSWTDNSNGEQGFKIDRCTNGSEWQIAYGIVDANQTAYVDTNVFVRKSTYPVEYRVYAYHGEYSSAKPTVSTDAALTPPSNLQVTQHSISSITLNWTDNSTGEEGFRIERKHGDGDWQLVAETKEVSIDDNEFDLNTTVYYRVSAYSGSYSSASAEIDFDSHISPPTNLLLEKLSDKSYKLTWSDNTAGEQGFKIDRRVGTNEWEIAFGTVDENQITFTDPNVYNAKSTVNLEYRVYAYFESYESAKVLVNTDATITPPTNLTITNNSITSVTLNWQDNSTGEDGFKVERKHGEGTWQQIATTTSPTFNDTDFELNTQVYYRVCAYAGQYSSSYAENDFDSNIPSPTNLLATSSSLISLDLNWDYSHIGHQGFKIDRKVNDGIWEQEFASVSNVDNSYTDNAVNLESNNYTYRIYAYFNQYNSAYAEEYVALSSVSTEIVTSITATTAISGGNIADAGSSPVTARGVVWNTSENPTVESKLGITSDGTGAGTFISNLTSLAPNTTYYLRAYATNSLGTNYGNQQTFTTLDGNVVLSTTSISSITATTATCGGNITSDGGAAVTARGVVWSTNQNPTTTSNQGITTDGTGTGSFTSNLIGLTTGATYYVRAYATNSVGTSYGDEQTFTTLDGVIVLTTSEATAITAITATSGGNVTSDGGAPVTARGVVWSTTENPTVVSNQGITTNGSGTGTFTSSLTELTPSTTYYVRAYATNSVGTSYGVEQTFTTLDGVIVLTTSEATAITAITATSGGNATSDGGAPITARGVVWSTTENPTVVSNQGITTNGSGTGTFTSSLTELSPSTTYYLRAYATNSMGTTYGNSIVFKTAPGNIGDSYGGGVIAYIFQPGDPGYVAGEVHGLIATPSDQSTSANWGCYGTTIDGTSGALGTGMANTLSIVNGCSEAGIAARICNDLVLNGYSDWYLPSKDELNKFYINRAAIGGFAAESYWSSTEYNATHAWEQYFDDGGQGGGHKGYFGRVRAVRAF